MFFFVSRYAPEWGCLYNAPTKHLRIPIVIRVPGSLARVASTGQYAIRTDDDVEHLDPDLPLQNTVKDLRSADRIRETCAR